METPPEPNPPSIPTPETKNYEPLPAIVIPENVAREIKSARQTVAMHIPTAKAVILLERSAPILYEAVRPAQADRSKEIRMSIGTEINKRYQASHPEANLQIAGTDQSSLATETDLSRYSAWLDADPTVQQIIEDLARQLSSLHLSPGDNIVCLDDIAESGTTAFTAAHILHKAQARMGLPGGVMFQGSKAIRAAIDADTERDLIPAENVRMLAIFKNSRWLHEIMENSFGSVVNMYADPSPQDISNGLFLYEMMKGSVKKSDSVVTPLTTWHQCVDLGSDLHVRYQIQIEPDGDKIENPATILSNRFGTSELMSLHEKLMEAMKNV